MADKIQNFTDLTAWQKGHALAVDIYKITRNFPKDELFGLTSQLRRAGVSITSNIAEGFSRGFPKEKLQFYSIALGSLTEVQNQLLIARDIGYINKEQFQKIAEETVIVSKLINGLIKSLRSKTLNT